MTPNQPRIHKDLVLWQKAIQMAVEVHRVAHLLPKFELYGLASQVRRASVSIPSNIAEGAARRTTREFLSFLHIARGSWAELDTQLQLVNEFGYVDADRMVSVKASLHEVGRLLNALIVSLQKRLNDPSS